MNPSAPHAQQSSPDDLPPAMVEAGRHVTAEMRARLIVLAHALRMIERERLGWEELLFAMWGPRDLFQQIHVSS